MYDGRTENLHPGDPGQLGSYRILGRLGAGGMGTVFLADVFGTGKRVAVKVINPAYSSNRTYRSRFAKEVAAASLVTSRYTPAVLEYQLDTNPLYVVTEFVDGPSLEDLVSSDGGLTGDRLVTLAKDTASALRDIHRHDVVHRDLKPSNVMVAEDRAVLIDFGIAARMDEIGKFTSTGKVVGTLPYLAPEVLFGDRASTASDVYSWGCVIYYAATGRPPFAGDLGRIRNEEADVRAVPGVVRELVVRALAKEARSRPSVTEILTELDATGAEVVLCVADGGSYAARLRDFLVDAGLRVRVSSEPDALGEATVLLVLVSDRPSTAVTDMRSAARRLGMTVLPVVVGARKQPGAFLDARAGALPAPEHLLTLRKLARAPRVAPVEAPEPVMALVRDALVRRELVVADQLTTTLLLEAAGCAEAGWVGRRQIAAVETAFLRDCAQVWHSETQQQHGFLAQRQLAAGAGRYDIGTLARKFGWGEPRSIPSDYHAWVDADAYPPGFFPTLRTATATRNWFDRWSLTVSAVHQRIREERL